MFNEQITRETMQWETGGRRNKPLLGCKKGAWNFFVIRYIKRKIQWTYDNQSFLEYFNHHPGNVVAGGQTALGGSENEFIMLMGSEGLQTPKSELLPNRVLGYL